MARRRMSVVTEEIDGAVESAPAGARDEDPAQEHDEVVVIDGVIERSSLGEERALSVALVDEDTSSGIGISADELRRMVELDEERRAIIRSYIARNLKAGVDYGTIPIAGRETKPSLFKPGAEKICMLLQLRAEFEPDQPTLTMAGNNPGLFAYRCRLLDRYSRVVGEGRGASEMGEKRGWTVNNAIKIAEKRSQIDAVLRVVCLSEIFTQDIEDAEQRMMMDPAARAAALPARANVPSDSNGAEAPRNANGEELCNDIQAKQIRALLSRAGVIEGDLLGSLNLTSIRELTRGKAQRVIERLTEKAKARGY